MMDVVLLYGAVCNILLLITVTSVLGMAGLAVTYGLNLNARLSRWILSFCKLENKIISIERIYQYSQIPSEAPTVIEDSRPPSTWPENGTISINDLKVPGQVSYYKLSIFFLVVGNLFISFCCYK